MQRTTSLAAFSMSLALASAAFGQFTGSTAPPGTVFASATKVARQNPIVATAVGTVTVVWDPASGVALVAPPAPGFATATPEALAADGFSLIGTMVTTTGSRSPFFWTPTGGTLDLTGFLAPAATQLRLTDVSVPGGGSAGVVIGDLIVPTPMGPQRQAFSLAIGAPPVPIGDLPGSVDSSTAVAISASGQFTACTGNSVLGGEAFVHDAITGALTPVGALATGAQFYSEAWDISSDGSAVVGFSLNAAGFPTAYRWTAATGIVSLGTLPGGTLSIATASNTDGSIIVGFGDDALGLTRAWIWTQRCGTMRDLQTELITVYGQANAAGWTLATADGMSDTGFVAGSGLDPAGNTQIWTSQISRCWADFNGDGMLTPADTTAFNAAFLAGSLRADCDCDGVLTLFDFGCFNAQFAAGCP